VSKRVLWVVEADWGEGWENTPRIGFTRAEGRIRLAEFAQSWPGTLGRLVKYIPADSGDEGREKR